MATNDRADVTQKLVDKIATSNALSGSGPAVNNFSGTLIAGMSEHSRTDLERRLGGRVTGGEGGTNAR